MFWFGDLRPLPSAPLKGSPPTHAYVVVSFTWTSPPNFGLVGVNELGVTAGVTVSAAGAGGTRQEVLLLTTYSQLLSIL